MRFPSIRSLSPRQRLISVAGLVVLGAGVAFSVNAAGFDSVGGAIFLILSNVVMAMTKMFASLTGIFISILVVVARYNTFLNAPVVQTGWPIVRDLMNMMFIIALLIIAAGTVLRLQNYRYNRLLGKLIIMAFLVNFSKFIAVFLLQFAQVVMLTFVNAFRDAAFGNFSHMFGLDAVLNFANSQDFANQTTGVNMTIFISLVAGLAMMLVAFVVMLAITVMLFVRIIALWLLIIMSPLAYALRILPNTEGQAATWWREFTKYAILGPVLAFFLWVSLALVGSGSCPDSNITCKTNPLKTDPTVNSAQVQAETDTATLREDFRTEVLSLDRLMTFIVGIIFLMLGLQYAQKSGAAGSSFAGKVATAGFGVASTLTGLNAIRDRTIAPVQGYLKERQRRRDQGIAERTTGLSARVDQGLSATVGQVGRVRAAAGGAIGASVRGVGQIATGQRTVQQVAQQVGENAGLGLQQGTRAYRQARGRIATWQAGMVDREAKEKDMANAAPAVLNAMRNSSGGATRMAAELQAMNRGTIQFDADSPQGVESLNQMLAAADSVQNSPELRKRYQDAIEKVTKRPSTTVQALRHILDDQRGASDPITRLDAGEELANRRLLTTPDAIAVNALAEATSADKATAFRKTLYAKQADVAIEALHNGLATEEDADSFVEAVDRGEAKQDILRMNRITGGNPVRERLRQGLYDMHRQKGTLEDLRKGMSDDFTDQLYRDLNMGAADVEDRIKVALSTGLGHVATAGMAAGDFDNFTSRYADKFAENAAVSAMQDVPFMQRLAESANFRRSHFVKMAKKNGAARTAVRASLGTIDAAMAPLPMTNLAKRKVKSSALTTSFGQDNYYTNITVDPVMQSAFTEAVANMEGDDVSSLDRATVYTAGTPDEQQMYRRLSAVGLKAEEIPKAVASNLQYWRDALRDAQTPNLPSGAPAPATAQFTPDAQAAYLHDIRTAPNM